MYKNKFMLYLTLSVIILTVSCTKTEEPKEKSVRQIGKPLKIAVIPASESLPFLVATHYGISDSLGLNLEVETFGSSMDADTAFQYHHVDAIMTDMVKAGIAESQGDSVSVVMSGDWNLSLVVSRQSRIASVSGLKDRIISITRNSVVDMYLDKLLQDSKMESTDVNKPQINDLQIRYRMLEQNQYDGAILPDPWAGMCVFDGCKRISAIDQVVGMEKMMCVMVHDSTIHTRSDDVRKLIKAYNKSVDYINNHSWFKTQEFLRLLGIEKSYPFLVFGKRFRHAALPSEGALSTGKSWSSGRNLLGRSSKDSLLHTEYVH